MLRPKKIYLDYNSTTPVDPRVLEFMLPFFSEKFGNASSTSHAFGWDAEEAVNIAREQVANLIGARPAEIYFTSGATEAINLAIFGVCGNSQNQGNHIITCVTEHKAVLDTCHQLERQGYEVTYLKVDKYGSIDLEELRKSITHKTVLISLMYANNEIGVIHPLKEIGEIAKEHKIPFLTDATQAVGKIPFDVGSLYVDIAVSSAHKLYGPKGAGALFVRNSSEFSLKPHLFGGSQERGLRPGTLNVPAIVGFGKACEICANEWEKDLNHLAKLRDLLEYELTKTEDVQVNGHQSLRLPHMTNLSFHNIDGSRLIRSLKNLAVSQGSACTSATWEPSHVLKSIGLSDELALSSIRLGMGRFTTEEEIHTAIKSIKEAIEQLKLPAA
jgi:cysteine desulfurase